ncbi:MAG TPA: flagellar assembly protein FliW [Polyangiaceae bacterium]|jgi:flagellar assembly factor FliW|nr:flagellar assembly protein FliW [Polyangiaceae bacterium]
MQVQTNRFGTFEVDEKDPINFPQGMIGFPSEKQFVLLRQRDDSAIGWLQSTTNPSLAFPVVSIDALAVTYPTIAAPPVAAQKEEEVDPHAVMAVLCASAGQPATVNLLAPIVVNVRSRKGAQILLEGTTFSTNEPFVLRNLPPQMVADAQTQSNR